MTASYRRTPTWDGLAAAPPQTIATAGDDAPLGRWADRGACREHGHEVMVPETAAQQVEAARAICPPCPVRVECLDHAMTAKWVRGVWGGTTERERDALHRQNAAARRVTA